MVHGNSIIKNTFTGELEKKQQTLMKLISGNYEITMKEIKK